MLICMLSTLDSGLLLNLWVFVCCQGCWIVVRLDAVAEVLRLLLRCWSAETAGLLDAFIKLVYRQEVC
jgi:hypothetical protein